MDQWQPPATESYPTTPRSFPSSGVNSLAPITSRWVARSIDSLLVAVPILLALAVIDVIATTGDANPEPVTVGPAGQIWIWGILVAAVIVYETVCVTLWGQTLGKLIMGIRVARQSNGRCPLWWEAAIRIALPGVFAVIPHSLARAVAMGLFMAAMFDPIQRGVPDRAAGTVVVRSR